MAATPSTMIQLGTQAARFSLYDTVSDKNMSLQEIRGESGTVIMFICNHCPFVKHINHELVKMATEFSAKGIGFAAISSNDVVHYPQDGPEKMKEAALALGYPFPYLYDETQEVARAYDAACTPDFFVYDKALALVYRGQLDDSRPGNGIAVSGSDLRQALTALSQGMPVSTLQKPSIGCSIKWKKS
jgi:peroxiredoxin